MLNPWNRLIYRAWAPVYDVASERLFAPSRRRALDLLALKPGERVLIPGVGTGADLPYLPTGVRALGVDLSPAMLARARAKLPLPGRDIELVEGDAENLPGVAPSSFDAAVLHLILAVVPDGAACLRATMRALVAGGRAVVFDKFVPDGQEVGQARRALNTLTSTFGTDVTRRFGDLARGSGCRVEHDEPALFGGVFRILLLRKDEA